MRRLVIVAAVGLMLVACSPIPETTTSNEIVTDPTVVTVEQKSDDVTDWKDSDTGCHYLVWNGQITPKLQADGNPICD